MFSFCLFITALYAFNFLSFNKAFDFRLVQLTENKTYILIASLIALLNNNDNLPIRVPGLFLVYASFLKRKEMFNGIK